MAKAKQRITIQTLRQTQNHISVIIVFDDKELTITGSQEPVTNMSLWILTALQKEDRDELMKPFFKPFNPGKPTYFPLISEEGWVISINNPIN